MWTKKIGFLDLSVSARSWGVYIPDGVLAFRDRPPGQTDAEAINDCINAAIDLRLKDETAARDDIAALQMLPERVSTQPVVSIEAGKTAAEDFRGNWLRRSGVIR